MAYNEPQPFTNTVSSGAYPVATATIRAQAQSPMALEDLAKASAAYAQCASTFIEARDALTDARNRWQECRDAVAKTTEQENV
jgi:hypothetical protein